MNQVNQIIRHTNVLLQLVNTKVGTHNKKRGLVDKRIKT